MQQQQQQAVVAPPVDATQQKEYDARAAVTAQDMTNYVRVANFPPIPSLLARLVASLGFWFFGLCVVLMNNARVLPCNVVAIRKGFLKPCFHVNIEAEIPVYGQLIAKHGMFVWALYSFTLLFNFFCVLAGLACSGCDGVSVSCVRRVVSSPLLTFLVYPSPFFSFLFFWWVC